MRKLKLGKEQILNSTNHYVGDLSILIDDELKFEKIHKSIKQINQKLIKEITLFDVYDGKNLPKNKKSYGISFKIQNDEKTLSDNEIEEIMNNVIDKLKKDGSNYLGEEIDVMLGKRFELDDNETVVDIVSTTNAFAVLTNEGNVIYWGSPKSGGGSDYDKENFTEFDIWDKDNESFLGGREEHVEKIVSNDKAFCILKKPSGNKGSSKISDWISVVGDGACGAYHNHKFKALFETLYLSSPNDLKPIIGLAGFVFISTTGAKFI